MAVRAPGRQVTPEPEPRARVMANHTHEPPHIDRWHSPAGRQPRRRTSSNPVCPTKSCIGLSRRSIKLPRLARPEQDSSATGQTPMVPVVRHPRIERPAPAPARASMIGSAQSDDHDGTVPHTPGEPTTSIRGVHIGFRGQLERVQNGSGPRRRLLARRVHTRRSATLTASSGEPARHVVARYALVVLCSGDGIRVQGTDARRHQTSSSAEFPRSVLDRFLDRARRGAAARSPCVWFFCGIEVVTIAAASTVDGMARPGYGRHSRPPGLRCCPRRRYALALREKPASTADHQPPLSSVPHPGLWVGVLLPSCRLCSDRQGSR